jgi:hypothetical protein
MERFWVLRKVVVLQWPQKSVIDFLNILFINNFKID